MGHISTKIKLIGSKGKTDVKALVDTGSSLTVIPESIANKIGMFQKEKLGMKRCLKEQIWNFMKGQEMPHSPYYTKMLMTYISIFMEEEEILMKKMIPL